MISHGNCIELVLGTVPEFEPAWQAHLKFWGNDKAGLSNDLAEFASYLIDNIDCLSSGKREDIFLLVERCLSEGDDAVKDAVATCFLENLLNAVSEKRIEASSFVKFLGAKSRTFCEAWDDFTGLNTPGL